MFLNRLLLLPLNVVFIIILYGICAIFVPVNSYFIVWLHITASIYVVRKIRASIDAGEQLEKPITTPCSASGKTTSSTTTSAKETEITSRT